MNLYEFYPKVSELTVKLKPVTSTFKPELEKGFVRLMIEPKDKKKVNDILVEFADELNVDYVIKEEGDFFIAKFPTINKNGVTQLRPSGQSSETSNTQNDTPDIAEFKKAFIEKYGEYIDRLRVTAFEDGNLFVKFFATNRYTKAIGVEIHKFIDEWNSGNKGTDAKANDWLDTVVSYESLEDFYITVNPTGNFESVVESGVEIVNGVKISKKVGDNALEIKFSPSSMKQSVDEFIEENEIERV